MQSFINEDGFLSFPCEKYPFLFPVKGKPGQCTLYTPDFDTHFPHVRAILVPLWSCLWALSAYQAPTLFLHCNRPIRLSTAGPTMLNFTSAKSWKARIVQHAVASIRHTALCALMSGSRSGKLNVLLWLSLAKKSGLEYVITMTLNLEVH